MFKAQISKLKVQNHVRFGFWILDFGFPRRGRRPRRGFTLMEIVVAMFIFSLASVIIASIFVNVQRVQQRIRNVQTTSTDARYLLDVLAREIRSDTVDYPSYTAPGSPCTLTPLPPPACLLLLGSNKQPVWFRKAVALTCGSTDCVQISRDRGVTWKTITSPNLSVDLLNFYVTPLTDPFAQSGTPPDVQPQVTIVLSLSTVDAKVENRLSTYLQTTVTSRAYVR